MAYLPLIARRDDAFGETTPPPGRSVFRKILDAIVASQQRRAEREIARFLRERGGNFDDGAGREIERSFPLRREPR